MQPTEQQRLIRGPEPLTSEQSTGAVANGLRALSGAAEPSGPDHWRAEAERQDRRAVYYDELYEVLQPVYRSYEDWVTEAIYSCWYEGRGRLLLVGCGTGAQLQRLAQRMPIKLITAIDLAPEMTRRAREKVPAAPEVRTAPFDRYLPAVPFDVIAFNGSFAAMPDFRAAAEHAAEMTIPGSRVVVCARNADWALAGASQQRAERLRHPSWYLHRLRNKERIEHVAQAGEPEPRELHAARATEAFRGRFGLRELKTDFGITRLFESTIAIPPEQALKTVGPTRERRPYMRALDRLRRADEGFLKKHPAGGGVMAMLFDKLN